MKKSFEEQIQELEKIINELENGNLNLDDSVIKFEEGMKISKECNKMLENAEKKITILVKKEDGLHAVVIFFLVILRFAKEY